MSSLSNDPIDLASWPELDEVDVVAVLPPTPRLGPWFGEPSRSASDLPLLDRLWRFPFGETKRLQCGSG